MKVILAAFLVIQMTFCMHEYTNLEIFNAEVDKEFRDFLKGRNLKDIKQRERYLKDIQSEKSDKKKDDRKLQSGEEQLQNLVNFLLQETDPKNFKLQDAMPKKKQVQIQQQQKVVQQIQAEHRQQQIVHKAQQQPAVLSPSQKDDNDIMGLFESLLGKGNWVDDDNKKVHKRNVVEPEDDSEDPEHNHHWEIKHAQEPVNSLEDDKGDIDIDHSLFKIKSNGQQQKPDHMIQNQKVFEAAQNKDPFGLQNAQRLIEEDMSSQQLQKMMQKLSYYENLLKQENEASTKTKKSILVLLQQISNKFHLPQKFQNDIKALFEEDGIDISSEEEKQQKTEQEKMNQILDLIGFKNLATLEDNSLHNDEQDIVNGQQNPINIKNDIDSILQQFLQDEQNKKNQLDQMRQNQNQENPLQALQELIDNSQHADSHDLQNQQIQQPLSSQPQDTSQGNILQNLLQNQLPQHLDQNMNDNMQNDSPIDQALQNQTPQKFIQLDEPITIEQQPQMIEFDNIVQTPQSSDSQNITNQNEIEQNLNDLTVNNHHDNEPIHIVLDGQNQANMQSQELHEQPIQHNFLDQDAPVAFKDQNGNVVEFNNPPDNMQIHQNFQNLQTNENTNEQHNQINNKEQMHHFTITLNDEEKGTKKTYKINCIKGNCQNEDTDSPFDVQLHPHSIKLI